MSLLENRLYKQAQIDMLFFNTLSGYNQAWKILKFTQELLHLASLYRVL